jgi:ElaA protein
MKSQSKAEWQTLSFAQLDSHLLYQIMKLRVDVFIVEQNCPYPELDNKDHHSEVRHIIGMVNGDIAAYCRVLPTGLSYSAPSIGRVIVAQAYRADKLGHELLRRAIESCETVWPNELEIKIGAQQHLKGYYQQHGFIRCSEMYLEDGIPHIDMVRNPTKHN